VRLPKIGLGSGSNKGAHATDRSVQRQAGRRRASLT
jgi:hypothetical protein